MENEGKVLVSSKALYELLRALNGPAHYVAELQVLRKPPFGDDNCINILEKEYNEYVDRINNPKYECHKLDTDEMVRFYEQDFYVLSNFSSFSVFFGDELFPTSEHAYHYQKFIDDPSLSNYILHAPSAHEAFKRAEQHKEHRRADWDNIKVDIMYQILMAKTIQHEYVKRKLMATGDRLLVEDSWRDDFWGWGPNRDGKNMLGETWMRIRSYFLVQEQLSEKWSKEKLINKES
jgi:ribA/ribD-fused uncharacterized protein